MLFGQGEDGLKHAVFIEMKQYSNLICCDDGNREGQEYVFTNVFNNRSYNCPNPSKQVTQYKDIVGSYNSAIQNGDIIVDKMVYLHNLDKSILGQDVIDELENSYTDVKVFYEGEIESVLLRMDQARCFEDVLSKTLSHLEGRENGSIPRVIIVDELQRVAKKDFTNLIEMLEANPCATVLVAFNGLGQRFRRSDVEAFEYDFDQKYRLDSQFRCGGIVWLDKVLFNKPSRYDRNHIYFDFEIVDTVEELFKYVADSSYVILAGPKNGRKSIKLVGR